MRKIGWKVVKPRDEAFCSAVIKNGPWSCRYAVGERTTGRTGTPVLAFRTRDAARRFKRTHVLQGQGHVVFRARLENPHPQSVIVPVYWPYVGFRRFWDGDPYEATSAPDGTLACDAITLLERA